jgi:hypothetical protein
MFGLNMNGCGVWAIDNYAEAAAFFERCPTSRGMRDGVHRAIRGKEGSRTMGVRMSGDNICFRYHSTDVVIWHPDNSYSIDLHYDSASTRTFANRFIPSGHYAAKQGHHLVVGGRVYPAMCRLTVSADGVVSGMRYKFRRHTVDRKRARQILTETNFYAYKAWHDVMYPMIAGALRPSWKQEHFHRDTLLGHLRTPDHWHDLMVSRDGDPEVLRAHLYATFNGYKEETVDTLPDNRNIEKWRLEA